MMKKIYTFNTASQKRQAHKTQNYPDFANNSFLIETLNKQVLVLKCSVTSMSSIARNKDSSIDVNPSVLIRTRG